MSFMFAKLMIALLPWPHWLHRYGWHQPHDSLKANTPINRLGLSEDNLSRLHS
jgi:hypothetical protein